MWIGWVEFDVLLGDVHSLKEKRSVIRPLIANLSRRTAAAAAEVGAHDLHRRTAIGLSVVGADLAHVRDVLDRAERVLAEEHPEVTLLSVRRGLHSSDD
ncbi:hypothetical protein GCM10017576_27990 [Microbacterium barkeri]|uniref:DUF503 domain-containing protein n=1 Tax=Microbacterium barkeri TaxID=33917 RepID=A0A9W6LXX0_9MICO|nr:DUF503 family protein [Microbacterium barkeri]MDR6877173.1 uncharacterized protein YlxP (DUF503 family) [Microbacterium barkeri]GLJ62668.1 hypothetical protein GCM10017576_27990 [Microbacterium barkeri]